MIRKRVAVGGGYACIPRASGDDPIVEMFRKFHNEYSPRERG